MAQSSAFLPPDNTLPVARRRMDRGNSASQSESSIPMGRPKVKANIRSRVYTHQNTFLRTCLSIGEALSCLVILYIRVTQLQDEDNSN